MHHRSHALVLALAFVALASATLAQKTATPTKQEADPLHVNVGIVPEGAIAVIDGQPVTLDEFCNELASQHLRPAGKGLKVVEALVQSYLISRELTKYGLSVTPEEIDAQIAEIDQRLQKRGSSLKEQLETNKVPMAVLRQKLRLVAGLDKLVRRSKGNNVPANRPISDLHRNAWLKDKREASKIAMPPKKLPVGVVATVDGHRITAREFAKDFMITLEPAEAARVIENIMQEKLVMRLLASRGLKLTEADLLTEWNYRKKKFQSNPRYKGIPYDDIVKQQTGLDATSLRASLGFRVNAAVGVMSRNWFTPVQIAEGYKKHESRYGPRLSISHILIEGSDDDFRQKTGTPSLAVAKSRAEHVLGELENGLRFEDLARVWSKDRATAGKGGVLPTFTPGRSLYEQPIIDCAMRLKVGEVSKPVLTRSGYHLVKLRGSEPSPGLDDAEVKEDLRRFMAQEVFTKAYQAAKIGINFRFN